MELQPSLTCAGKLVTTTATEKNTSDEAVRDFSVIVDYTDNEGMGWRMGYQDAKCAGLRRISPSWRSYCERRGRCGSPQDCLVFICDHLVQKGVHLLELYG